jgi:hypothetical protein
MCDIQSTSRNIKAFVAFVESTRSEKSALFRSKLQFMLIIGMEIWSTSTPKDLQKIIITVFAKETLHGSLRGNNLTRKAIDQIDSGEKSLIPKFQWHECISKERQTNLDSMSMFALSWIILLMCVRTQKI